MKSFVLIRIREMFNLVVRNLLKRGTNIAKKITDRLEKFLEHPHVFESQKNY